jgi:hypothetical protein
MGWANGKNGRIYSTGNRQKRFTLGKPKTGTKYDPAAALELAQQPALTTKNAAAWKPLRRRMNGRSTVTLQEKRSRAQVKRPEWCGKGSAAVATLG